MTSRIAGLDMPGVPSASRSRCGGKFLLLVMAQEMPATTRGLPSTRPRMNCGKDFGVTSVLSTSTKATVAFLSDSGNAAKIESSAAGPVSFSFAMAFCVAGLWGSLDDRISLTSRSARILEKKPIQPFRRDVISRGSRGQKYATAVGGVGGMVLF